VKRELFEELRMAEADLAEPIRCIGMAQDKTIRQPELIFAVALE